jgi:glutathione S-transferase
MNTTQPSLVLCELAETGIPGLESFSPFCLKAHRALRAAGLAYERRHLTRPDEVKAYNPQAQVPVLLVDGAPVPDSTNILQRIEQLTGGALTRGLDPAGRAEAWLWEELADGPLNGFLVAARWADDRNWPVVREAYFKGAPGFVRALIVPRIRARVLKGLHARDIWRAGPDACWSRFLTLLEQLDARAPEHGFWVGSAISVADVALFGQLQSFRTHLTRFQGDQLALRGRLVAYLDRVDRATRLDAPKHAERTSAPRQIVTAAA